MVSKQKNRNSMISQLRNMSLNRRLALVVSLVFVFIFLTFVLVFTYKLPKEFSFGLLEVVAQYHLELMFLMSALGVAVGAFAFYLLYERIEIREAESGITAEMLLGFLSGEDRKIILYLVKNHGSAYQSELSRLEGITRLRVHRAVFRLEGKQILAVEKIGKTNKIILNAALYGALLAKQSQIQQTN
ncbi:hypothetical protein FJZ26_02130 [Candidatus Parvarchaeota archaeon]|nr:hypothetical protein [Candidatus Parvarchaeota archaeon]